MYSPTKIATTIKSITARETFKLAPEVKEKLWRLEFWSKGFFINTVGQNRNEKNIANYLKSQGKEKEYQALHKQQLKLFP